MIEYTGGIKNALFYKYIIVVSSEKFTVLIVDDGQLLISQNII